MFTEQKSVVFGKISMTW